MLEILWTPEYPPFLSNVVIDSLGLRRQAIISKAKENSGFPEVTVDSSTVLRGDCSIARFLCSLSEAGKDLLGGSEAAQWLDLVFLLESDQMKMVDDVLTFRSFLTGRNLTLADFALFARMKLLNFRPPAELIHLNRWFGYFSQLSVVRKSAQFLPKPRILEAVSVEASSTAPPPVSTVSTVKEDAVLMPPLPGAKEGHVMTRFPPEPSGYLHLGHVKAMLVNDYYARRYNGKLLLRFDDTNPSVEEEEFEKSIVDDLALLNIKPDLVSHTSDSFPLIQKFAVTLIKKGLAFMDNTPTDQMREERMACVESSNRNLSLDENLRLFEEMLNGTELGQQYCLRAKIDMGSKNGVMRDPVIYRCNLVPHPRCGTKYKAYPTYDLACPIVDSVEGVTHAFRTTEYRARDELYSWVLRQLELRAVHMSEFGRLEFIFTVLSKRKLRWFVNNNVVGGWDDPRFPTVRGLLRRGVHVGALRHFVLSTGSTKRSMEMEWDKFWSNNRKFIDDESVRFTAVTDRVVLHVKGGPASAVIVEQPAHPKNPSLGTKYVPRLDRVWIEKEDATAMVENEEVTLWQWGNCIIREIVRDEEGNACEVFADLHLEGDCKKTKKRVNWIAAKEEYVHPVVLVEYDFLITVPNLNPDDDFTKFVNPKSCAETAALAESTVKDLKHGTTIQILRRGHFRVDEPFNPETPEEPVRLICIPDGKVKAISTLSTKLAHR